MGRVDRGVHLVWFFAHHEHAFSKLEVCDSSFHCRLFLWMDMAEDGINFCVGVGACGRGCFLALFVSNAVS